MITEVENEATVAEEVVSVTAKLKIEILAEGWNEVPMRLNDAAILAVKVFQYFVPTHKEVSSLTGQDFAWRF